MPRTVFFCGCLCRGESPMIFKRIGLAPAMMNNPLVVRIVSIIRVGVYINFAKLLLVTLGELSVCERVILL